MNVIAEIQRINERELALGVPLAGSWHQKYRESAWVYAGGLPFELSEGDVLCVLSQFGEIEDLNLVRDVKTGKSKGFAFVKFQDQRSTVLAVDNLNGAKILERVIRVDHVLKYKLPKELRDRDDEAEDGSGSEAEAEVRRPRGLPGHAYEGKELASSFDIAQGVDVFAAPEESKKERKKRRRDEKKQKKEAKKRRKVEKKQQKLLEEVRTRHQQERRREKEVQAADGEEKAAQPSATGWRGRLEPTAAASTRPDREKRRTSHGEGSKQQDRSFGGMSRVR